MSENILLIDKEVGWTSNDVVRKLKAVLKSKGVKKIGHAGTLDPFATGLLVILLNEGTKMFDTFQNVKKEYIAEIEFGKVTDTYDIDGQFITNTEVGPQQKVELKEENIKEILKEKFSGKILQTPPAYSALKIDGKRLYDLARSGQEVKIQPREVEIYESEILKLEKNILTLRVLVSSGTYIRSIAYDLGRATGYGAYCKSLRRTRIGDLNIKDAKKISDIIDR
jgi:tRNA pseudouridine55 synthase